MRIQEKTQIRRRNTGINQGWSMDTFKEFDLFPKFKNTDDNEYEIESITTNFGGFYSMIGIWIIIWILLQEIYLFVFPERNERLVIDKSFQKKLNIKFDIVFHALPCNSLGIDIMDVTGEQEHHVNSGIKTFTIDKYSNLIPYKQQQQTHLFRLKWNNTEGCLVRGDIQVQRVSGNFHIAMGPSSEINGKHIHKFIKSDMEKFNCSHTINHLSFGPYFSNQLTPLNDQTHIIPGEGTGLFTYYITIQPVQYISPLGYTMHSNQFKYILKYKHILTNYGINSKGASLPGVFFVYKFSPFMMEINEKRRSLVSILIDICALCGGIYQISNMMDSYTFNIFYAKHVNNVVKQAKQLYKLVSPQNLV